MYKWLYRSAFFVALAMMFHAFYFWGGVALSPDAGDQVMAQALKSPVEYTGVVIYSGTGKGIFGMLAPDSARNYAELQVGDVYPAAAASTYDAAGIVRAALKGMPKYSHFGAPWAFIVAMLLYWRREKEIKSLGR